MFARPFTAICQKFGKTTAVNIDLPGGKEAALESAKKLLPDQQIVALIPGDHARYAYTYNPYPPPDEIEVRPGNASVWPENITPGF